MKRTLFTVALISFVLVLGFSVLACGGGGGGGSPSAVIKQYHAAMSKGNLKGAMAFMEPEMAAMMEGLWAEIDSDQYKEAVEEAKKEAAKTGGIVKTEEEIDEDKATVIITYKDGSTETMKMVKLDGKWKITMGK